jgi:hypothetical protein
VSLCGRDTGGLWIEAAPLPLRLVVRGLDIELS